MVKERGIMKRILATVWLATASLLHAGTLSLSIEGQSTGQPFSTQVYQPFTIIIRLDASSNASGNIDIEGLNQLQVLKTQRSNNFQYINGAMTATLTHHLTVRAEHEGSYTLGPAKMHANGQTLQSNTVSINVGKATSIPVRNVGGRPSGHEVTSKLVANKNEVVVGEPIEVTYILHSPYSLVDATMGNFKADEFSIKEAKQHSQRQENINGTAWLIIEKRFMLIPNKEGTFSLGPIPTDVTVRVRRNAGAASIFDDDFFASMFGGSNEPVHVVSNELTIKVRPLPTTDRVEGVGRFVAYRAQLSAAEAQVNEPLKLT
ncbi:protein BatD, partial [Candidatus Parvarchaeota archaeon]|nr:protein BatD [Candidatus Parvarchaeota archaeon]